MQIAITGRNLLITEPLKDYANEKVNRIKKYFHKGVDVHVILSVEKFRQKAEITVNSGGIRLHSAEETEDMYSSIDKVMDKIDAQARKFKEKGHTFKSKSLQSEETSNNNSL